MKIKELIRGLRIHGLYGSLENEVTGISYDSRIVKKGDIFVALKGTHLNGHRFIYDAIKKGARAILVENMPDDKNINGVTIIQVENTRRAMSKISINFFNLSLNDINIIGITGTNGKTTTSYLIESILKVAGKIPGVIGTINYRFCEKSFAATVTTPESVDLMRVLKEMRENRVTDVIMEVSSHALAQDRVADCPFKIGVFTNITRDHLDYHGSMEEYFKAKAKLFLAYKPLWSVINVDDSMGNRLIEKLDSGQYITFGLKKGATIRPENVELSPNGIKAKIITPSRKINITSPLIGIFNLYNILAAVGVCYCLGIKAEHIKEGIKKLENVPGRMEIIKYDFSPYVIVDYAHTPDALLKVLQTIKKIFRNKLITVFGCGGNRDQGKRKEMGKIAAKYSDIVIVTSDNPRLENPYTIIKHIEHGIIEANKKNLVYFIEADRKKAIEKAIIMANKCDVVLIAGKGHENFQIIGDKKMPFEDKKVIKEILNDKS